jgi:hypothetical protein
MVWNEPSLAQKAVKPGDPFSKRRFPKTDYAFHAGLGDWRGYWPPSDDDGELRSRSLAQQYLIESARERTTELIVFGAVVIASAWPVIYMVVTVVKLLLKGRPLD